MTDTPDDYAADARDQSNHIKQMVEAVSKNEQGVREFLDELASRKLTDETAEIREELRTFAAQNPRAFHTLMLTTNGTDSFFADLEDSDVPTERIEMLRDIHDKYSTLSDAFMFVHYEGRYGAKNPWVSIRTGQRHDEDEKMPLMDCDVTSHGVVLGDFRVPPSHALSMADLVVAHAGYVLRDVYETDREIDADELDDVQAVLDELGESLETTQEIVEAVDDDEDETVEDIDTHDENYYFN